MATCTIIVLCCLLLMAEVLQQKIEQMWLPKVRKMKDAFKADNAYFGLRV